jgi:hypothetical protein
MVRRRRRPHSCHVWAPVVSPVCQGSALHLGQAGVNQILVATISSLAMHCRLLCSPFSRLPFAFPCRLNNPSVAHLKMADVTSHLLNCLLLLPARHDPQLGPSERTLYDYMHYMGHRYLYLWSGQAFLFRLATCCKSLIRAFLVAFNMVSSQHLSARYLAQPSPCNLYLYVAMV